MTSIPQVLLALLVVVAGSCSTQAEDPLRVLFIGNSYTAQVRGTVTAMFEASDHSEIEFSFVCPGGATLANHLDNKKTIQKISEGDWDYVVLQDQSQTPAIFRDKFRTAATKLDAIITSSGAQTVFYQTWGRRDGDKQNAHLFPTYDSMQKALSDAYVTVAEKLDAKVAPVGDAWATVRSTDTQLGRALYAKDGSHPSKKGAYLVACVFYCALTGDDPATVDYTKDVSQSEANAIRAIAYKTVAHEETLENPSRE